MSGDAINVLFVCKDNSVRSVIAHALMNRFGGDRFRTFSCGLEPAAEFYPRTIEMLSMQGLPIANGKPRGLQDFLGDGAREMDLVINLCDEPLPALPGNPFSAHWRITDPLSEQGDSVLEGLAFKRTLRELENRVRLLALVHHPSREERHPHEAASASA